MRLRQLARKLAVKPADIVEFLGQHNIPIEEEANTRLDDSHVTLIMKQFNPEALETETSEFTPKSDDEPLVPSGLIVNQNEPVPSDFPTPKSEMLEVKPEVIKAPIIELSGLKVIGKIELPEPKKKEIQPTSEAGDPVSPGPEQKSIAETRNRYTQRKVRKEQGNWKNPLAQAREREAREAEKKRQADAQFAKEQRTRNYFKRVKTASPTKRVHLVEEQTMEMSAAELKEPPKTLIGRFFNWLRS